MTSPTTSPPAAARMLLSPASSPPGQEAIAQIERRRRSWFRATAFTAGMLGLAAIWAIAEYHIVGGWPASGFSQSSGIPGVWIIYRAIVWVLAIAAGAWWVFGRKPVSQYQITREMERQAAHR